MTNRKKTILCVDDEEIILISLVEELKFHLGNGYIFETASSGISALALIENLEQDGNQLDFIISDCMMPEMKGDELLNEVRKKYPKIKTIMITGFADEHSIGRALNEARALAVLGKPWDSKALIELIKNN